MKQFSKGIFETWRRASFAAAYILSLVVINLLIYTQHNSTVAIGTSRKIFAGQILTRFRVRSTTNLGAAEVREVIVRRVRPNPFRWTWVRTSSWTATSRVRPNRAGPSRRQWTRYRRATAPAAARAADQAARRPRTITDRLVREVAAAAVACTTPGRPPAAIRRNSTRRSTCNSRRRRWSTTRNCTRSTISNSTNSTSSTRGCRPPPQQRPPASTYSTCNSSTTAVAAASEACRPRAAAPYRP